jgi:RsiW-degrading membrane proteinase PrsW (M82 family)
MTTPRTDGSGAGTNNTSSTRPAGSPAPVASLFLACFSGPDAGKRIALTEGYLVVGSSPDCNVLSDDPDVALRHAVLALEGTRVSIQSLEGAGVFIDGHKAQATMVITHGQQLRLGRSLWRISNADATSEGFAGFIGRIGERISTAAGVEKISGFSVGEMFSEVFKKRTNEEREEYFTVGTRTTTPHILQVDTNWPKPWAFARTFLFSVVAYFLLVYGFREFQNNLFLPGIIVVGSIAFPLAILVFFFEMNVMRNISWYQIAKLVVFGGIFSLVISLFAFRVTGLTTWLGAMAAGIIEESGKLAALLVIVNRTKYRGTLNGLLIGAAVGTGFSVFETMGYVMIRGMLENGIEGMFALITRRGWLNVLGDHSLWTGMVGAALWRVRGDQKFRFDMLSDPRFLRVFLVAIALHMINNAPIPLPLFGKYLVIGFVAWVVLLSMVQAGLKEVREEQLRGARAAA